MNEFDLIPHEFIIFSYFLMGVKVLHAVQFFLELPSSSNKSQKLSHSLHIP